MPAKISAGILMYRRTQNASESKLKVFLIHPGGPFFAKRDEHVWSIPKGMAEEGEKLEDVARREFKEETGTAAPAVLIPLGEVRQKSGKIVHAWAFEGELSGPFMSNKFSLEWPPHSGKMQEFPEADKGEFFDPATARQKIVEAQAQFIDRLEEKLQSQG